MIIPSKVPTNLEILNTIYELYHEEFLSYNKDKDIKDKDIRDTKIYVPIDCQKVADILRVDGDIVFIRLYSYLERKHGYKQDDGSKVGFFALKIGEDRHCVNFPLMVAVLADLSEAESKFLTTVAIGILVAVVPLVSFLHSPPC